MEVSEDEPIEPGVRLALAWHAKTAGYLYQAALRAHVTGSLGVGWEVVHNGTADVTGIPRKVIERT